MKVGKKEIEKAYGQYIKKYTPRPAYLKNTFRAFTVGGAISTVAYYLDNLLQHEGINEDAASSFVTIGIIMIAQLLTGLGAFDTIAKFAGAGVIVPISGFANSMVAPAIEYKKEGPVLGAGSKMFTVAGPVLVCGISAAMIVGCIYWILQ